MRKRHYDDYDYEEAYQKQIENLEEWELEWCGIKKVDILFSRIS